VGDSAMERASLLMVMKPSLRPEENGPGWTAGPKRADVGRGPTIRDCSLACMGP